MAPGLLTFHAATVPIVPQTPLRSVTALGAAPDR